MTELRPERPEDIAALRAVHTAAFETPAEAGLVDALRASDAWLPDLSVVAVDASGAGRDVLCACRTTFATSSVATSAGEVVDLRAGSAGSGRNGAR